MSVKVPMTEKALNLIQLKENMDEVVFNYIDTSQKWEKAYTSLGELLTNAVDYFKKDVNQSAGELPKENTYWVLFMDITSKLIYFHTLAFNKLKTNQNENVKEETKTLLKIAANCIPNVQKITNAEFLNEIANTYEEIEFLEGKEGEFERVILKQNNVAKDCLQHFANYIENYY